MRSLSSHFSGRLHELGLDRRRVLARLGHGRGFGRVGLLYRLRDVDQIVLQLTVAVLQQLLLSVKLDLEIQRHSRDHQDHVDKRVQSLIHISFLVRQIAEAPSTRNRD